MGCIHKSDYNSILKHGDGRLSLGCVISNEVILNGIIYLKVGERRGLSG